MRPKVDRLLTIVRVGGVYVCGEVVCVRGMRGAFSMRSKSP
jgi:predicted flavoprotein YhiN